VRAFTKDTTNITIMSKKGKRKHINSKEVNKQNKDGEK
jgi:hypothetical protein